MDYIKLKGRAKINLALDVLGKRPDGYHELNGVMQSLELCDTVYIKKVSKKNYLKLVTNLPYLPVGAKNIAYRAASLIISRYNIQDGVFMELGKRIPVSAGLAGGSTDGAAVLIGMKTLFDLPISWKELYQDGLTLGADVPFCLMRGTAQAQGVGERLTRLPPLPQAHVLLVKPPVIIQTAEIFSHYTDGPEVERPDMERLLSALRNENLTEAAKAMGNALESVTAARYPVIRHIKSAMLEQGALGSVMSGSGPTVFGLFDTRERAVNAAEAMHKHFPGVTDIILTRSFN